jgi:hypothetical protein
VTLFFRKEKIKFGPQNFQTQESARQIFRQTFPHTLQGLRNLFSCNDESYRISGASTLVTFSVVIDPQLLDPGDRIVINGNLPEFTGWQDGLAMVPSENSYLWTISLELPFSTADSSPYGIFRYRYEILTRNGNIIEGNLERTEQVLRSHYFHFFRGNFRAPRFRGWIAPAPKDLFQYFCRTIIAEFSNDSINIDQAFKRHGNLISCFPDAHRLFVEILFEEYLQVESNSIFHHSHSLSRRLPP